MKMPSAIGPESKNERVHIKVVGIGDGGIQTVNQMIDLGLLGVEYIAMDTSLQSLNRSRADKCHLLGSNWIRNYCEDSEWDTMEQTAKEKAKSIYALVKDAELLILTAGMGGYVGTSATPTIARIAKDAGILTIGIVSRPFAFEGLETSRIAEKGITKLKGYVDFLVTIPYEKLFSSLDKNASKSEAFFMADDVHVASIRGIADIFISPDGLMHLDFADIKYMIESSGEAYVGIGQASGDNSATQAAQAAISSPLIEMPFDQAKRVLVNLTCGPSFTSRELYDVEQWIGNAADQDSEIMVRDIVDKNLNDTIRVTVFAIGKPFYRTFNDPISKITDLPPFLQNKNLQDE